MSDEISASPPSSFRYQKVLRKGKPTHETDNRFALRHPPMDLTKRAKIFSPFDALRGFSTEIIRSQAEVTGSFLDETDSVEEAP